MNKKNNLRVLISLITIILLIVIDQVTKLWAISTLKDTSGIDIIDNVFRLQYLENRGAAFGMMEGQFTFFYIITPIIVIVAGFLLYRLPTMKKYLPLWISGNLLIAGAIGNLIDRIYLNYVVDFLYFEYIDFPIFNVADIYVCIAAGLYMILLLFYYKDEDFEVKHEA